MLFDLIWFLLGLGIMAWLLGILIWILSVVAMWMIFTKAGECGWKSLIPIYNVYILYKISWSGKAFAVMIILEVISSLLERPDQTWLIGFLSLVIGAILLIIHVFFSVKLAGVFGKGLLFAAGLFFFNTIFILILGLGSSHYHGPQ